MTNYEKYKDQIDWQARVGAKLAVKKSDNTPTACARITCDECAFFRFEREKSCVLPAIEWLKAECVDSKENIEVWDEVEVMNNLCCYTTYADWVMGHVSDVGDILSYDYGKRTSIGDIGIVKEKGLHFANGEMLYYIELKSTGRCYLISKDGIKLHKKGE